MRSTQHPQQPREVAAGEGGGDRGCRGRRTSTTTCAARSTASTSPPPPSSATTAASGRSPPTSLRYRPPLSPLVSSVSFLLWLTRRARSARDLFPVLGSGRGEGDPDLGRPEPRISWPPRRRSRGCCCWTLVGGSACAACSYDSCAGSWVLM